MAVTSVASGTSSVTLLASSSRRFTAIRNTDANVLYVLLGAGTASATNHSFAMDPGAYWEDPSGYTGTIAGVWAGDGSGVALVTAY